MTEFITVSKREEFLEGLRRAARIVEIETSKPADQWEVDDSNMLTAVEFYDGYSAVQFRMWPATVATEAKIQIIGEYDGGDDERGSIWLDMNGSTSEKLELAALKYVLLNKEYLIGDEA